MKLNYWIKPHKTDSKQTLRARTKGEVEIAFAKGEGAGKLNSSDFGASFKVTVEYKDGYDLMTQLRNEGLSEKPAEAVHKHTAPPATPTPAPAAAVEEKEEAPTAAAQ